MALSRKKIACLLTAPALFSTFSTAGELEEVIVTSQHREQNVQDVPITVTAISADELREADIFDAATIAMHVPGMAYAEFGAGQALISMRGISSTDDGAGLDNSVGLFLDGVFIGRLASINFDMFDLQRIEVLKGPQGTLFGRNSIGGAISVVTEKPSDEFKSSIGVTVGNEGIFRYQGLVSGPFSDNVAGKLSISHREHDGFVDNVLLGTELQDEDQTSLRGQLRFSTESSDWLLSADWMEDDRADMGRTVVEPGLGGPFVNTLNVSTANGVNGPRKNAAPADGFSKREASGISLQGDIEFAGGMLTSITAVRQAEADWEMQSVGAGLGGTGIGIDEVFDDIEEEIDTFSQELRWTSNLNGNFNYTAGFFFFREETDRTEQFKVTAAGTYDGFVSLDVGAQPIVGNEYTRTENETNSYAIYGQGTWDISEALSLTFGARYTLDEKDYRATAVDCGGALAGTQFENFAECQGRGGSLNIVAESFIVEPNDDWDDFSPMLSLQYRPTDGMMVFGSVSRGFKSGGFAGSQGVEAVAGDPVEPETATNFEVGFKGDLANNTLRLNATLFFTDYEDLQIVRFGPVAGSAFGTFVTANIGSADIKGFEMDFVWNATDRLSFSGNYAYLDSEVNDLFIVTATSPPGGADLSGKSLRQAPENSYNLVAKYMIPLSSGTLDLRAEYSHTDRQRLDYLDDRVRVDEHDLIDARIAWTSESEKLEIALWGKNLAEEDYISHSYVIGPGVIGVWGAPRTVGLSATWKM
ncbi:MAG: TonB-dependent receptor [Pseudomonadales bacterium]